MAKGEKSVYEIVTDQVLNALEKGTVPWHQPWSSFGILPSNLVSKKAYRGINPFLLTVSAHAQGFSSPYWLSFKQAQDKGGTVRKGEHATLVTFWKQLKYQDKQDPEKTYSPMLLRYYRVFNVEQCEGIEIPAQGIKEFSPIAQCDSIVEGYLETGPGFAHGGDRACYSPSADVINMPLSQSFESSEKYYSTLFHEMTHSTGHASRLNREGVVENHHFGDELYSKEELIAEMGAAMLAGITGIEQATLDSSAAYVSHWLRVIKGDEKLVVSAAGQAQKAADLIQGISYSKNKEEDSADN